MSGPEGRLKTCVQCGAILQAADPTCASCRASQPAPGAPRPPLTRYSLERRLLVRLRRNIHRNAFGRGVRRIRLLCDVLLR